MRSKLSYGFLVVLIGSLYLTACDTSTTSEFNESIDVFTGLEAIQGASNTTMVVNKGDDVGSNSFFQIEIKDLENNSFIKSGIHGAWCIEWKKPLRSNNEEHKGVNWYSTHNSEKWKPLNYLFIIRDQLEANDPDLTFREIQAVVWTLAGNMGIAPEFDVETLSIQELPGRLVTDGKRNFSIEKVKAIEKRVMSEYSTLKYKFMTEHSTGSVGETGGDEQDVFVPGDPTDPCDEELIDFNKVDVMLLFDDTGSFAGRVPTVQALFPDIIAELEATFPGKDFAFGVSRFEDYGGPGTGFSGEFTTGRPFILNQPLVTQSVAGGAAARNTLIQDALGRTAPGFGGDGPETAHQALFELATGNGFDGDGDGNTTSSGDAGSIGAQTSPGTSGDVPAFATNVLPTSGTLGGAGWRTDAQKIVILATDICSVAPIPASLGLTLASTIEGQPGTSEAISRLVCSSSYGFNRYGDIADAKTAAASTVPNDVVPSEVPTVLETVEALTTFGIQVIGLSTTGGATDAAGPSTNPSVFLSALANLTGAVDPSTGDPLVFGISSPESIAAGIVEAVGTSACDASAATTSRITRFTEELRGSATAADDDTSRYSNYVIFE